MNNQPTAEQLNNFVLPNMKPWDFTYVSTEPYLVATITQNEVNSQHTGAIQGGVLCTLAETVANMAGQLVVPQRYAVVGQTLNINYCKAAKGVIRATAKPLHSGRRSCVYSVEMTDSDDNLVAIATFTGSIVKQKG